MKQIKIEGFTTTLKPDDRPAVGLYGLEGTGKTRFAATAPDPIGLIALDKKSRRTFEQVATELGKIVLVNEQNFMSDKEAIDMAMKDGETKEGLEEIKRTYTQVVERVFGAAAKLGAHPDVETVVVDTCSQLFEWILFSHFGRRNKIPPVSRAAPNQDMIDFVNALRHKNLVLIHRAKEIWKKTGQVDRDGQPIKEPSGQYEHNGYRNIGGFLTVNCEMINKKTAKELEDKFKMRVLSCQTNALLEGQALDEYGLVGEGITWDNLMAVIGMVG